MLMLLVKSLHIIAVISWMAGLLYLPRLFAYHAGCDADDTRGRERFETMEARLFRRIMGPAMVATILLGFWLLSWFAQTGAWIVAKLVLVAVLFAFHMWCGRQIRALKNGAGLSERAYKLWNEVPTVAMVGIVLLVVFKPF